MDSGKVFVVVLVSVVSTYAAITAWPAVKELFHPLNGSAVGSASPAPAITPPTTPAMAQTPAVQNIPAVQLTQASSTRVRSASGGMPLSTPRLSTIRWNNTDLKFARRSVVMLAKPGGETLKAVSLNRTGLTILRGTRLMPVKYKGDWVMVQSPSAMLGWVHSGELTDERPAADDDHFALNAAAE